MSHRWEPNRYNQYWLVVLFYDISTLFILFNNKFNFKTVLFQAIQPGLSTQFSSIWSIARTLSSAITLGQSEPGSDSSEGLLCIPQRLRITGTLPSDCLGTYPGHSLVAYYSSAEKQSVYSTALPTGQQYRSE